jgi:hypothetical protein
MAKRKGKEPGIFDVESVFDWEIQVRGRQSNLRDIRAGSGSKSGSRGEAHFLRMVNRAPEVMVKVTGGGMTAGQIKAHMKYISRNGKLDLETETGDLLETTGETGSYAEAWEIDSRPGAGEKRQAYNIMLSMPPGTNPEIVRQAGRAFAKEEFGGKYPYAMVLHTDKAHPHVHICVRMTPEERTEQKLFVRKDTLQKFRQHFADKLIERGIEAAATPRQYRGVTCKAKSLVVHHAEKAGRSTVQQAKVAEAAKELQTGRTEPEPWKDKIAKRRAAVLALYAKAAEDMEAKGKLAQAAQVRAYMKSLPPLETERDRLKRQFAAYLKSRTDAAKPTPAPDMPPVRSSALPQAARAPTPATPAKPRRERDEGR